MVADDDLIFLKTCSFLGKYNEAGIKLARETRIVADLEVDSVEVFDLIMEVEDEYAVSFPMELVSEIQTIGELVDTIRRLKSN